MKRTVAAALTMMIIATSLVAVPRMMTYQGKLTDIGGVGYNGDYTMTFRIFDVETGGSFLWQESYAIGDEITVTNGLFDVELGSIVPINLSFDTDYWLEIEIGGNILIPRVKLMTSPYAFRAAIADSLAGSGAGSDGDWQVSAVDMYAIPSGNVGIGTTVPGAKLEIGTISDIGLIIDSPGSDGIQIDSPGDDGIEINSPRADGVEVSGGSITGRGLYIHDAAGIGDPDTGIIVRDVGYHGILIDSPGQHGVWIGATGQDGVAIDYAGGTGVSVWFPAFDGMNIRSPGCDGVEILGGETSARGLYIHDLVGIGDPDTGIVINDVGTHGIYINSPGTDGIFIESSAYHGLEINEAGARGVFIDSPAWAGIRIEYPGGDGIEIYGPTGDGIEIMGVSTTGRGIYIRDPSGFTDPDTGIVIKESGHIGVFVDSPAQYGLLVDDAGDDGVKITSPGGDGIHVIGAGGYAGLFEGEVSVEVLKITGGADLSEQFEVKSASTLDSGNPSEQIEPGTVVCIDPENPGELIVSQNAYDRTVAGIISGAGGLETGMIMGQEGTIADGGYPVALSGRVYCRVDATNGSIRPGDILTTSDTPGYAMKVADYSKAQGAIIGKAMSSLENGRGFVLVLVSLH